jgi:hypothetical protein
MNAQVIADDLNTAGVPWVTPEIVQGILGKVADGIPQGEDGEEIRRFSAYADNARGLAAMAMEKWAIDGFINFSGNLPYISNTTEPLADGRFNGVPLIIVGGSEDIHDSLDALWALQGNAVIMAVDAVWRIVPCDFVVNVDIQPKIINHYASAWTRAAGRRLVAPIFAQPAVCQIGRAHV